MPVRVCWLLLSIGDPSSFRWWCCGADGCWCAVASFMLFRICSAVVVFIVNLVRSHTMVLWPSIGFTVNSSRLVMILSLEPLHDMLLFVSDMIESLDLTTFTKNGLLVLDGEFRLMLQRRHSEWLASPCSVVWTPTLYVWSISASTRKSRDAHEHVSQCFTLAAFNLSSKYLAIPSGEMVSSSLCASVFCPFGFEEPKSKWIAHHWAPKLNNRVFDDLPLP